MFKMIAAGVTNVGRRRKANEDAWLAEPSHGVVAVADGMCGHAAGDVASAEVVTLLRGFYAVPTDEGINRRVAPFRPSIMGARDVVMMDMVLRWVNHAVYDLAQQNLETRGMGSTVVVLRLSEDGGVVTIGHLGDSRCYKISRGSIEQLTVDHSLIAEMSELSGKPVSELIAQGYPGNIITRSCGLTSNAEPTVSMHEAEVDDIYVLCSDGVTGEISDQEILDLVLASKGDVNVAAETLVLAAVTAGGRDNATAVVARLIVA